MPKQGLDNGLREEYRVDSRNWARCFATAVSRAKKRIDVVQYRIGQDELVQRSFGAGVSARLFHGSEYGLADISLMFGEVHPGSSVALHRHDYEELFVIHQGEADFFIGDDKVSAHAGDLILIPSGAPHRFVNTGDEILRQTAVHAASGVVIEWLE